MCCLKNLKSVRILEGAWMKTESEVTRRKIYSFSIHELPNGREWTHNDFDEFEPLPPLRWTTGMARAIQSLKDGLEMESIVELKNENGERRDPPEFLFGLLKREVVDVGHGDIKGADEREPPWTDW